jgi:hypothetical protein
MPKQTPTNHRGDALIDLECMSDEIDEIEKLPKLLVKIAAHLDRRAAAMRTMRDSADRSLRLADAAQARIDADRAAMRATRTAYTGPERRRVLAEAA